MSNGADSCEVDIRRTSPREAVLPASVQKSVLEVLLPFLQSTADFVSTRGLGSTDYCIRPDCEKAIEHQASGEVEEGMVSAANRAEQSRQCRIAQHLSKAQRL